MFCLTEAPVKICKKAKKCCCILEMFCSFQCTCPFTSKADKNYFDEIFKIWSKKNFFTRRLGKFFAKYSHRSFEIINIILWTIFISLNAPIFVCCENAKDANILQPNVAAGMVSAVCKRS